MLSDEEKKAVEIVEDIAFVRGIRQDVHGEIEDFKAIEDVLRLVEKQQKEIEELKQIKRKLDEKNIPIETLLAEFERLEDLEDDLTTVYLNGVYDGEKKVQDKIKAKIEELNNKLKNADEIEAVFIIKQQQVLQSLLEKE